MGIVLSDLNMQVKAMAATWPTARCETGGGASKTEAAIETQLERHGYKGRLEEAIVVSQIDKITTGSSEPTEKRGALNPEFVCWLMGFPPAWVSCGVSAMQSIRDQRRSSSKRI